MVALLSSSKMKLAVLLLFTSVFSNPNNDKVAVYAGERIIGGEDANIEDVPYIVSLRYKYEHTCGASIISEIYAITAAHCVVDKSLEYFTVKSGSASRTTGGTIYTLRTIHQHPNFTDIEGGYDIAILEIDGEFTFDATTAPIVLPEAHEEVPVGSDAVVSGWGTTTDGGVLLPDQLQTVTVQTISNEECTYWYAIDITETMICANVPEGGKDACGNDSGGPMVVDGKLTGIVSWGIMCGKYYFPGVYARVPELRGYIEEITGI